MAIDTRTSAKDGSGTFQGVALGDLTTFELTETVQVDEGATSSTSGQIDRTAGHEDVTGSFTMQRQPSFSKGAEGTLVLNYKSGESAYNGGALITEITPSVPIADGTRMEWSVSWGQKPSASSSGA